MNDKPKCDCGTELNFYMSVCTDPECCGIPNEIECIECNITNEYWDFSDFEEAWEELGGKKEDLYE